MTNQALIIAVLAALSFPSYALAEDDIDVAAFEYIDVVETADGSMVKGVVVEQVPNVHYKIATAGGSLHVIKAADVVRLSKQRNSSYRRSALETGSPAHGPMTDRASLSRSYSGGSGLPAPYTRSGIRVDPELVIVFPSGDLGDGEMQLGYSPTVGAGIRIGYEIMMGNLGLSAGGLGRFISWTVPDSLNGGGETSHWTVETHAYGRAAFHIGRVAPYAGVTFGLDTNGVSGYGYGYNDSETRLGLGMNLQGGITISASQLAAIEIGVDYHPGTDTIAEGSDASVSFLALRVGASLRL
jgi:hypothetical protein